MSKCKYREFPHSPVLELDGVFEVLDTKDTLVAIDNQKTKTKTFFLKGTLTY